MAEQPDVTAPEPGSAAYYVVRFAPATQRSRLGSAFALAAELARMVERSTDPGITRLKLDWWRQELGSATASHHPLVRQLAPLVARDVGIMAVQRMLDAAEADVRRLQPADTAGFHQHCLASGALAQLLVNSDEPSLLDAAQTLGQYGRAVQRIQCLGKSLRREHNPLPGDSPLLSDHHDWEPDELAGTCASLLNPLREASEPLLRSRQPALTPVRRWAAQARALHRLLEREGYAVRDQYLDVTPLTRLWVAWRMR
jgi:phytoene synthase